MFPKLTEEKFSLETRLWHVLTQTAQLSNPKWIKFLTLRQLQDILPLFFVAFFGLENHELPKRFLKYQLYIVELYLPYKDVGISEMSVIVYEWNHYFFRETIGYTAYICGMAIFPPIYRCSPHIFVRTFWISPFANDFDLVSSFLPSIFMSIFKCRICNCSKKFNGLVMGRQLLNQSAAFVDKNA